MSIDSYGAKLTRRDVSELAIASDQLVVAAETIRGMGPKWGEAAVNLLIAVNAVVTRIQNKGASAFARYLEKHQAQEAQDAKLEVSSGEDANPAPESIPGEPKE
jgi:hypothetical protein